ncbi:MAG: DUF4833 domain-containing protein [Pseudarcicella sp.]|nr:DUF4833 domain-containing protein [Pseudarcicella sp.]MBP6410360.1 DUF4833 domain-containing protein [Pseudarcicella sp.]
MYISLSHFYSALTFLVVLVFSSNINGQKTKKRNETTSQVQYPVPAESNVRLFYLQRSTNINTVIYDANLTSNRKLDLKNPTNTYWVLFTENGIKKELTNIQRTLAYGLKTSVLKSDPNAVEGHFLAYKERTFTIKLDAKGTPIALFPINGKKQILKRIFVKIDDSGMMPKVLYVELWGKDVVSGKDVYEKFKPS